MMTNERGGILSKLLTVPVGVAIMVAFFFLGYYVGKHQGRDGGAARMEALPDMANQYLPRKDDLTFYKTLTESHETTVSVPLPQQAADTPSLNAQDDKKTPDDKKKEEGKRAEEGKKARITISREDVAAKPRDPGRTTPEAKKAPASPAPQDPKSRFTVQVASYPDRELAEDEVRRMKKLGYAAFVVSGEVPERGTWHRVRLGSFQNRSSAERLARELQSKAGVSPIITQE